MLTGKSRQRNRFKKEVAGRPHLRIPAGEKKGLSNARKWIAAGSNAVPYLRISTGRD